MDRVLERAKLFIENNIEEAKIIRVECLVDIALDNISMAEEVTKKINALYSENRSILVMIKITK
ncbi:MAG: hypothetical protein MRQ11_03940 [Candidatus Midichloria mitochondrii]|uniref:hypothetical protein n=1 Tax=Candidatus Midichloria mitochondrii TaxID=234827 RepID=UPI0002E4E61B|nr:hypothetical protein [Candidatus Midichloria mitochondrii]MDJ1256542.1 hypothetical protein [Candidatus Midichloria mitochondrii]MDJ1583827.1 hypothetical protein [Candidatus Midichloria mitochondrii]